MNELDHSGFSTQTTTIFAGNIGGDRYIVQVSDTSLRLLEGGECQMQNYFKLLLFVECFLYMYMYKMYVNIYSWKLCLHK